MPEQNTQENPPKFKVGDIVNYRHYTIPTLQGTGEIIMVNDTGDGIEYAIKGIFFLFWEEELTCLQ